MPKRPCAITVTADNATILCADKFGDVYSLPLLVPTLEQPSSPGASTNVTDKPPGSARKAFEPAASSLTVHTERNKQALRNQLKATNKVAEKRIFNFEYQLLLGHVSLLTDLVCVTLDTGSSLDGGSRSYIITSDRDEHVRISRGLPQAHVIEGYCFGHTEFVNRIKVPKWRPKLLISGGGDDYLVVWDWLAGKVLQKVDLSEAVGRCRDGLGRTNQKGDGPELEPDGDDVPSRKESDSGHIALSGIWFLKYQDSSLDGLEGAVLVACEG